ncbi:MAG: hypothetical protein FWF57_07945 [Defluviitaleaceae bacterium]|nr:hypothetical protein [Defluviitaleaceae bacterium]
MKTKKFLSLLLVSIFTFTAISNTTALANAINPNEITLIESPNWWMRPILWQEDLEQFRDAVLQSHPRFWDDTEIFLPGELLNQESWGQDIWNELQLNLQIREDFLTAMDELISNINVLSDFEIFSEARRAANIISDSHFTFQLSGEIYDTRFPLGLRFLGGDNGHFYLLSTTEPFAQALNHRLLYINDIPIDEIIETYSKIGMHENRFEMRYRLSTRLTQPLYLAALGLYNDNQTKFTFGNVNDLYTLEITLTADDTIVYENNPSTELEFLATLPMQNRNDGEIPRFLRRKGHNTFEIFEEKGLLYIVLEMMITNDQMIPDFDRDTSPFILRFNEEEWGAGLVESAQKILENISDYTDDDVFAWESNFIIHPDIIEAVEQGIVNTVIIEGRGNGGGTISHFLSLYTFLQDNIEDGRLFYFTDGGSFSAGSVTAVVLSYLGFTIVGEPAGQNTIFHGTNALIVEDRPFNHTLNHSEIYVRVPNSLASLESNTTHYLGRLGTSAENFLEKFPDFEFYAVFPEIEILLTLDNWINNEDPVLNYVIDKLNLLEN